MKLSVERRGKIDLDAIVAEAEGRMARKVQDFVTELEAELKRQVPVRTGRLRNGIRKHFSADGRSGWISSEAPYTRIVNDGGRRIVGRHFIERSLMIVRQLFRGRGAPSGRATRT